VLTSGVTIARLALDDPNRVRKAVIVTEPFPEWRQIAGHARVQAKTEKAHKNFEQVLKVRC
jgi:hypothetical protein